MNKKPIIIDVDTGIDDAMAIAMACFNDSLDVKLITCVAGNCSVGRVAINTLNLLQAIGKSDVLVAEGAKKPLIREREENFSFHGRTGIGEFKFKPLEGNTSLIDAVTEMREVLLKSQSKVTIVCLGPLTNIANLLKKHPEVKEKIEKVVISGGVLHDDKQNPYPSFNVFIDPEAAEIVLNSDINKLICPSDMGHIAYLNQNDVKTMSLVNQTGKMFEVMFESYHDRHVKDGVATHDSCAIVCACEPEIVKIEPMKVRLRMLDSDKAVLDFDDSKPHNMSVVTQIDKQGFKQLFFQELTKMP